MNENENKEIEQELSLLDEQRIMEEAEKVIAERTEDPEELPELVFAEDLFDTNETDIPETVIDTEFMDAEDDLFFGVNAALTEQIENEFGSGLAPTEEKKPNKVAEFLKDIPTWTKVLVCVILVLLLSVGFLFGTKPGRTIFSNVVVKILFQNANVIPNETPTPGVTRQPDLTPEPTGTVTPAPTGGGEIAGPTDIPVGPTATLTPTPTPVPIMDSDDVVNILLLGEENIFGASLGRTDAILVASIDKRTGEIGLVSFLRDTYVLINHPKQGKVWDRLNAAYSAGGATLMMDTIENNFGVDIDSYVLINFEGFEALIDELGGLKISLTPAESEYLNTTRYISNPTERNTVAGVQMMSGSQVLGYCRVRKVPTANGLTDDYGRTYRQRVVLKALFDKYKEKSLVDLYMVLRKCLSYVTVPEDLQTLAAECLQIVIEKKIFEFDTLQMPKKGYYYDTKTPEGQEVLGFYPENIDILQEFLYGETAE